MGTIIKKEPSPQRKYTVLIIFAVIALLAIGAGLFYAMDRSKKDIMDTKGSSSHKVTEMSFVQESTEAHRQLDNILLKKNTHWQLAEESHKTRDIYIAGTMTKLKLSQRVLNVGLPNSTSVAGAATWVKERAEKNGLTFISGKETKRKQWEAYKIVLGIKVKAGEGQKTLVTDTITFYNNGNLTGVDRDVKDAPPVPEQKQAAKKTRFKGGKIAIIVNDCGADAQLIKNLLDTDLPLTYAILPFKKDSSQVLQLVQGKKQVAMLHLPMEPFLGTSTEPDSVIMVDYETDKQRSMIRKAMESLPGIIGVSNHEGSRATCDPETVDCLLGEIKENGFFFVDSMNDKKTIALKTAKKMGIATAEKEYTIDKDEKEVEIKKQLDYACFLAEQNDSCVVYCHATPSTVKTLVKYAKELKECGVQVVPVTELL